MAAGTAVDAAFGPVMERLASRLDVRALPAACRASAACFASRLYSPATHEERAVCGPGGTSHQPSLRTRSKSRQAARRNREPNKAGAIAETSRGWFGKVREHGAPGPGLVVQHAKGAGRKWPPLHEPDTSQILRGSVQRAVTCGPGNGARKLVKANERPALSSDAHPAPLSPGRRRFSPPPVRAWCGYCGFHACKSNRKIPCPTPAASRERAS